MLLLKWLLSLFIARNMACQYKFFFNLEIWIFLFLWLLFEIFHAYQIVSWWRKPLEPESWTLKSVILKLWQSLRPLMFLPYKAVFVESESTHLHEFNDATFISFGWQKWYKQIWTCLLTFLNIYNLWTF